MSAATITGEHQEGYSGERQHIKPSIERVQMGDPGFDEAKKIEFEVFERAGFAEDAIGELKQYRPYDPNSIIYLARSPETNQPIGNLRVIYANEENVLDIPGVESTTGFKTLDDFQLFPAVQDGMERILEVASDKIVEVGTAATDEKWRTADVSDALYKASILGALEDGKRYCIASIDNDLLKRYRDRHMFNFVDMGPSVEKYMGGPTTPVFMDIHSLPDYWEQYNPDLYRKILGVDPNPDKYRGPQSQ
jgi:hypothetical protein